MLLAETVSALQVAPNQDYIDATLGGGGHAYAILKASAPSGRLLGIDLDVQAIAQAQERLECFGPRFVAVRGNFSDIGSLARGRGFEAVAGILFDLGVSSLELETSDRGFSFQRDGPLDMRFDSAQELTAADIVNTWSQEELANLLHRFGEERHSRRIARAIIQARPLSSTLQLAQVITYAINASGGPINPATRSFQALRIAVNRELENLEAALGQVIDLLKRGGRLVVISFHSLEDRMVKQWLRREAHGCPCDNEARCYCSHNPNLRLINRKVITPSPQEKAANPRSRSARLRVAERLSPDWTVTP